MDTGSITTPRQAGLYTRISLDDLGDGQGVARQEQDTRAEAVRRGWEVHDIYCDNDVSATRSKHRLQYERLLADVRAGVINAVVFWDADRLTRTVREGEDLIDLVDQFGLAVANVNGSEDLSTDDGRFIFRIKVATARREVDQLKRRLKRKFQQRAEEGQPHGRVPYGFRRVDGRDVADPAEATVIREAAERVLAGDSLRSIATDLTARGVPGPTAANWSSSILRQMLKRPSLAGLRQYRGEVIGEATSDAVLSQETHRRLVSLLNDPTRRSNQAGSENKYLLSGIARCGRCGGPMRRSVGRMTTTSSGGTRRQPPSYTCSACFKVRRKQEDVDAVVEQELFKLLSTPDVIALLPTGDAGQARAARERLDAIDALLDEFLDMMREGQITRDQFSKQTAKLRTERAVVEKRRVRALPSPIAALNLGPEHILTSWVELPVQAQREIVEMLVTITIMPSGSGRGFDPSLIKVEWKKGAK